MRPELADLKEALDGIHFEHVNPCDAVECVGCGLAKTSGGYLMMKEGAREAFGLCHECIKEMTDTDTDTESEKKLVGADDGEVTFDSVDWSRFTGSSESFLESLKERDHTFVVKLSSFLNGDITLDDGSEHPLLKSIAEQVVDQMRLPTDKQARAFKGIHESLMLKKRAGAPLRMETPEERGKKKRVADKLVKIGSENIEKFTPKTRTIINSMTGQFHSKGSLSAKQIDYLRFLIEQLPPAILERYHT